MNYNPVMVQEHNNINDSGLNKFQFQPYPQAQQWNTQQTFPQQGYPNFAQQSSIQSFNLGFNHNSPSSLPFQQQLQPQQQQQYSSYLQNQQLPQSLRYQSQASSFQDQAFLRVPQDKNWSSGQYISPTTELPKPKSPQGNYLAEPSLSSSTSTISSGVNSNNNSYFPLQQIPLELPLTYKSSFTHAQISDDHSHSSLHIHGSLGQIPQQNPQSQLQSQLQSQEVIKPVPKKRGKYTKRNRIQNEQFICEHCGKSFLKNYNLKSHLKTHSDEKPYQCSFCDRSFARNHDKKRHELLHQGIKRFQCGGVLKDNVTRWGCGKRFSRADGLGRHFKTDIGWLCVKPLMAEPRDNHEDQLGSSSIDLDFINELIKRK